MGCRITNQHRNFPLNTRNPICGSFFNRLKTAKKRELIGMKGLALCSVTAQRRGVKIGDSDSLRINYLIFLQRYFGNSTFI